ncbi:hypothetical protein [Methylobacterium sp. SI9]|uniref:hypothetical protein n=1 Tax=Methylobacterium guangdongense TaxID=3138811 RepID=UPI00313BA79C
MPTAIHRAALAIAGLAFLAMPARAEAPVPRIAKGTLYETVRADLSALGWRPSPAAAEQSGCSIGREDVCKRYPEAEFCSGTGMGACGFLWSKNNTLIQVRTVGEDPAALTLQAIACRAGCRAR